jgi:nucleotide-binding universal stress UspA family protein
MTNPIVVGVALRDDDGAPIALGRDLSRLTGAPLVLAHAYPYQPLSAVPVQEYQSEIRERALAALDAIAEPLRSEFEVDVRAGAGSSPAAVLHDVAATLDAPLVVVGSTHRGRVGRVMPGSVTARLLHGTPCAVAVAPRGHAGGNALRRIGVAFVDTPEGREALSGAVLLAGLCGGRVRAITVHEPVPPGSALAVPGWVDPTVMDRYRREGAQAAAQRARELTPAEALDGAEVIAGHAADVLKTVSTDLDLLVCGSRGYGPVHAVMLGGVSRALVDGAACPVVVLPRVASDTLDRLVRGRRQPVES